jgi:hypothetical protein
MTSTEGMLYPEFDELVDFKVLSQLVGSTKPVEHSVENGQV